MKIFTIILSTLFAFQSFSSGTEMKKEMKAKSVGSKKSVDISKSGFSWLGTKMTGKHEGQIKLRSGWVNLSKNGKLQSGSFVMDINSITVGDLSGEWKGKFLGHIKAPDFFDVKQFPTAKLEITKVKGNMVFANLTIKNKTHPVKFKMTKKGKGFSGTLKFDRTKFGMTYKSGNFFKDLGDKLIHDEVKVDFNVFLKS